MKTLLCELIVYCDFLLIILLIVDVLIDKHLLLLLLLLYEVSQEGKSCI